VLKCIHGIKDAGSSWTADPARSLKNIDGALRVVENDCSNLLQSERVKITSRVSLTDDTNKNYEGNRQHFILVDCIVVYRSDTDTYDAEGDQGTAVASIGQLETDGKYFHQIDTVSGTSKQRHGRKRCFDAQGTAYEGIKVKKTSTGSVAILIKEPPLLPNESYARDSYGVKWQIQSVSVQPVAGNQFTSVPRTAISSDVVHRGPLKALKTKGWLDKSWQPFTYATTTNDTDSEFQFDDKLITVNLFEHTQEAYAIGVEIIRWKKIDAAIVDGATRPAHWRAITRPTLVKTTGTTVIEIVRNYDDWYTYTDPTTQYPSTTQPGSASPKNYLPWVLQEKHTATIENWGSEEMSEGPLVDGESPSSAGLASSTILQPPMSNADHHFYLTVVASYTPLVGVDFDSTKTTDGPTYTGPNAYQEK